MANRGEPNRWTWPHERQAPQPFLWWLANSVLVRHSLRGWRESRPTARDVLVLVLYLALVAAVVITIVVGDHEVGCSVWNPDCHSPP